MSKLNPDAAAAVAAARKGSCRTAMKHLFDASPHLQSVNACASTDTPAARDFKQASVIVAGLCTVDKKPDRSYASAGFRGVKRRRPDLDALVRRYAAAREKWLALQAGPRQRERQAAYAEMAAASQAIEARRRK